MAAIQETKKCPSDAHWVRAYFRNAYIRVDGTKVSASNVAAHCAKNRKSHDFGFPLFKNTLPTRWPWVGEKIKSWTVEEIERVLEALDSLPKALRLKSIKGIYRFGRSKDYPNPATSRAGEIVLYDTALDESRNLARILSHEFAHEIYRNFSTKEKYDSDLAANWFESSDDKGRTIRVARGDGFVELDGRQSSDEDFSNNVEYFLFEPEKLKTATPNVYTWIGKYFGDTFVISP